MAVNNLDITLRVDGSVVKAEPFISITSLGFTSIFTPPDPFLLFAYTMRFYQSANFNPHTLMSTGAFTSGTTTVDLLFPFTMRFHQAQNVNPFWLASTLANSSLHPLGITEEITRPVVDVRDTSTKINQDFRLIGKTVLPVSYQPPTEVYRAATSTTEVVDTFKSIVWWGGGDEFDFVYVEYRDKPTAANPTPPWKDSLISQAWVLANGADFVQPTFKWSDGSDQDESQSITYEFVIAFDFNLTNVFLQKEVGTAVQYTLTGSETLDVDQTYFWAVRSKDTVGDYSAWSRPQAFATYKFDPPRSRMVGSVRRIIIPFNDYHYDWNVGNLVDGAYQFRAVKVRFNSSGNVIEQQEIISEYEQRFFIVDHSSENPPEIVNVKYDAQSYRLQFNVRIADSAFRLYDIKKIYFADQKSKVLGDDQTGYHMDAFEWIEIKQTELIGRKRGLTSNPYLSKSAIMGWTHNEGVRDGKTYLFDVLVATTPQEYLKEFHWGIRSYAPGSITPSAWTYSTFDNTDLNNFRRPRNSSFPDEINPKQPYYGKANSVGVVMNKAYFSWDRGDNVRWDFALFYKDGSVYNQITDSLQSQITQPYARVTPQEFFDYDVTNILLDLVNIENNFYELFPQEVDKIVEAIPNQDFFWKVRARDDTGDFSTWSVPQQSQDFNIHNFEWDVRNDDRFASSDYIVLRVEIEPAVTPRKFEFPHFNWLNITNPQIDSYNDQIRVLTERKADVPSHLHSFYDSYINYLKRRIIDVRNYVLDSLINGGYFADGESFQGFIDKNMHDGPVTSVNGLYTSELDIHDEYMERIKDLHANPKTWSPAFYIWQLDKMGANFKSQSGRPLRSYDATGLACENQAYKHCWLTTQDQNSCPWFGKHELGFCKGFVQVMITKQQADRQGQIILPHLNPPDINTDPQGFTEWAYAENLGQELQEAAENAEEEIELGIGFDPGNCPMAVGASIGTPGGPCSRYKKMDKDTNKHNCEVCGEKRYPQFIGVRTDPASIDPTDRFSDLNPAGYAVVEIRRGDEQLSSWGPIARAGQSRNPQHRFTGFKLRKSELPGELNSDFIDDQNEQGIKKPHFKNTTLPAPTNLVTTVGAYAGNWFPITKPSTAEAQIIEII